jgi:hypothetical protein
LPVQGAGCLLHVRGCHRSAPGDRGIRWCQARGPANVAGRHPETFADAVEILDRV